MKTSENFWYKKQIKEKKQQQKINIKSVKIEIFKFTRIITDFYNEQMFEQYFCAFVFSSFLLASYTHSCDINLKLCWFLEFFCWSFLKLWLNLRSCWVCLSFLCCEAVVLFLLFSLQVSGSSKRKNVIQSIII